MQRECDREIRMKVWQGEYLIERHPAHIDDFVGLGDTLVSSLSYTHRIEK